MEVLHLLDYNKIWEIMYSYYTKEYNWLTKYCLRLDGKFPSEEVYCENEQLTKWDIVSIVNAYTKMF